MRQMEVMEAVWAVRRFVDLPLADGVFAVSAWAGLFAPCCPVCLVFFVISIEPQPCLFVSSCLSFWSTGEGLSKWDPRRNPLKAAQKDSAKGHEVEKKVLPRKALVRIGH